MTSHLKFGDLIFLYSDKEKGNLQTQGFSSTECFVQKDREFEDQAPNNRDFAFEILPKLSHESQQEYEKFFNKSKHLLKRINTQKSIRKKPLFASAEVIQSQESVRKVADDPETQEEQNNFIQKYQFLVQRIQQEKELNRKTIQQKLGEDVLYGQEIELMQFDSKKFLCLDKQPSQRDETGIRLLVVSDTGHPFKSVFQILPRFKYRQIGEKVVYNDNILLFNEHYKLYVHTSQQIVEKRRIRTYIPQYRSMIPFNFFRPFPGLEFDRVEVNASKILSDWQPTKYLQSHREYESYINQGTVLVLQHTEFRGNLTAEFEHRNLLSQSKVFLQKSLAKDKFESISSNSYFEIELDQKSKCGDQCVRWETTAFRLKHFTSGKYVSLSTKRVQRTTNRQKKQDYESDDDSIYKEGDEDQIYNLILIEKPVKWNNLDENQQQNFNQATLFKFEPTLDLLKDKKVLANTVAKIRNFSTLAYLYIEEKFQGALESVSVARKASKIDLKISIQESTLGKDGLEEQNIFQDNFADNDPKEVREIYCQNGSKDEEVYNLLKVEAEEVSDVLFVQSCIGAFYEYVSNILKGNKSIIFDARTMDEISQNLSKLIKFVTIIDETATDNEDFVHFEGVPIPKRQKICREQQLIEILVDMLYFPFQKELIAFRDLKQHMRITKVCQLIYKLLKNIVADNRLNEFYSAQWINLFFEQAMQSNKENALNAESMITKMLTNNKILLGKKISRGTIQRIVEYCKKEKQNKRFILMLSNLCTCQGQSISGNQISICEDIMDNSLNKKALLARFRLIDGEVYVYYPDLENAKDEEEKWIEITELRSICELQDDTSFFEYLLAFLELVSQLCFDKSYKGQKEFSPLFNFNMLMLCIVKKELPKLLRSQFIKILIHLHLESKEPIYYPSLSRIWDQVDEFKEGYLPQNLSKIGKKDKMMPLGLDEVEKEKWRKKQEKRRDKEKEKEELIKSVKNFATDYLREQKGIQYFAQKDQNYLTLQVLRLIESTLDYGFFVKESELIEIVGPLISLLDGENDKYENEGTITQSAKISLKRQQTSKQELNPNFFRYEINDKNLVIMNCKSKMCDILKKVLLVTHDLRISRFLVKYKQKVNYNGKIGQNLMIEGENKNKEDQRTFFFKSFNEVMSHTELDLQTLSKKNFVQVLVDLMIYQNEELASKAFELLVLYHSQNYNFFQLLKETQILEDKDAVQTLREVVSKLTDLRKANDTADFWFGQKREASIQITEVVQLIYLDLFFLCFSKDSINMQCRQIMDQNCEELKDIQYLLINQSIIKDERPFILEGEQPHEENQRLLKNLKAIDISFLLIKFRKFKFCNNHESYVQILEQTYKLLTLIVYQNSSNQQILYPYCETYFMEDIELSCGVIQLMTEIFRDSQKLLSLSTKPIYKRIVEAVLKSDIRSYKKATYMNCLMVFCSFKEQPVSSNQVDIVFELFQYESLKNSIRCLTSKEDRRNIKRLVRQMQTQIRKYFESQQEEELIIKAPSEICYLESLCRVLAYCCKGKNSFVEIKCQSSFPLNYALKLLKRLKVCFQAKEALICYIKNAIYDIENETADDYQGFLWRIYQHFQEDIDELRQILQTEQQLKSYNSQTKVQENTSLDPLELAKALGKVQAQQDSEDESPKSRLKKEKVLDKLKIGEIKEENETPSVEDLNENEEKLKEVTQKPRNYDRIKVLNLDSVVSYKLSLLRAIYIGFLPCVSKILDKEVPVSSDQESLVKDFIKDLIFLIQTAYQIKDQKQFLQNSLQVYEEIKIQPFIMKIYEEIKNEKAYIGGKSFTSDNLKDLVLPAKVLGEGQQKSIGQIIDKSFSNGDSRNNSQRLSQTKKNKGSVQLLQNLKFEKHSRINVAFKTQLMSLKADQELLNNFEQEFGHLITYIDHMPQIETAQKYQIAQIQFIDSLIQLSEYSQINISENSKEASLKLFRKFIEIENKDLTTPASEWEAEQWIKFKEKIEKKQYLLLQLDFIPLVCRIISTETSQVILNEAFQLSIALLLGGNHEVQMAYFDYITDQRHSTNFLSQIRSILIKAHKRIIQTSLRGIQKIKKKKEQQILKQKQQNMKQIMGQSEKMNDFFDIPEQQETEESEENQNEQENNLNSFSSENQQDQLDIQTVLLILKFLQQLCENHNLSLQNQLRQQKNKNGEFASRNSNFLIEIVNIFQNHLKVLSPQNTNIGNQILETLIEMVQGPCTLNQKELVNAKVINLCSELMRKTKNFDSLQELGFVTQSQRLEISSQKSLVITLLNSLLEGPANIENIKIMTNSVEFQILQTRLLQIYSSFVREVLGIKGPLSEVQPQRLIAQLKSEHIDEFLKEGFDICILILTLNDQSPQAKQKSKPQSPEQEKAFEFFELQTGRIEIVYMQELQRLYFTIKPVCRHLSNEAKQYFLLNVKRETPAEKVLGLIQAHQVLLDTMQNDEKLKQSSFLMTAQKQKNVHKLTYALACLINLIILFLVTRNLPYDKEVHYRFEFVPQLLNFLGIILIFVQFVEILGYLMAKGNLIVLFNWRERVDSNRKNWKIVPEWESLKLDVKDMSLQQTRYLLYLKGPEAYEFNLKKHRDFGNLATLLEYYFVNCIFILQDSHIYRSIIFLSISFIGFRFHFIAYPLLLVDIVPQQPTLQNVIASITQNAKQLILTTILIFIILYIYALIGFMFFYEMLNDLIVNKWDDLFPGEYMCSTMWHCMFSLITLGLRSDGGIGDKVAQLSYREVRIYYARHIYILSFYILITTMMLNLLQGIMIDTFAELRDNRQKIINDTVNRCFICNLNRNTLDRHGGGFKSHIDFDHNMWQYVFYMIHLKTKNFTELSGIESYVLAKIVLEDISWIPQQRALSLHQDKLAEATLDQDHIMNSMLKISQNKLQNSFSSQEIGLQKQKYATYLDSVLEKLKKIKFSLSEKKTADLQNQKEVKILQEYLHSMIGKDMQGEKNNKLTQKVSKHIKKILKHQKIVSNLNLDSSFKSQRPRVYSQEHNQDEENEENVFLNHLDFKSQRSSYLSK